MANIKLKRKKCNFFEHELDYIDQLISRKCIYPLNEEMRSIENLPVPKNARENEANSRFNWFYNKIISQHMWIL